MGPATRLSSWRSTLKSIVALRVFRSGRRFNVAVSFEPGGGPAIAESTFHHFADYNWDSDAGAPSFVSEPAGCTMTQLPQAMADTQLYVRNIALWLARRA